ncbi:unnamed protein product [Gongylonema pulchrum]|uniref:Secreted protein n=1 Tax=Gongylonema pulchrum TaxID=637853 RepID=A0A183ETR2_9BILA|nr:unnamed protein product [Gongylonema pulchrum]
MSWPPAFPIFPQVMAVDLLAQCYHFLMYFCQAGCLSARLRQNPLRALREALTVVRHGLSFLSSREVQQPQLCEKVSPDSEWINGFGDQFYK